MLSSAYEIRPGFTVKRNNLQTLMTVHQVDDHSALCYWFDGYEFNKAELPLSELVINQAEPNTDQLFASHKVKLHSGSPEMEIQKIEFSGRHQYANCTWQWNGNHYVKRFNVLSLRRQAD